MHYNRNSAPACGSYARAVELFEKFSHTPTGRDRKPNHLGFYAMNSKVMWTRMSGTDVIFRLHDTDVVTWHADDSFTVEPWESMSTSGFMSRMTPLSVGASMVANYFSIPPAADHSNWRDRWATARACYAEGTFHPVDGGYAPDESTLRTFRYPEVDRKMVRELSKAHRLTEFELWLTVAPHHLDLVHEGEDSDAVAEALKAGRFMEAAVNLPLIEVPRGFGLAERMVPIPIKGPHWDRIITRASVARFRRWLYEDGGAITMAECKTMTCAEYDARKKAINAFEKADARLPKPGFSWY